MLIPKVKSYTKVIEFEPISLCNVIYRVNIKVLADHVKSIVVTCSNQMVCLSPNITLHYNPKYKTMFGQN